MGIAGLLPFAKPASTEKHIKDFKGQTAAVDSYCWLHKGAFGCAEKLAMGEQTDGYIQYCFKYIDMLLTFKIKPIIVLDGQNLPAKMLTEKKRRESRNQARKRAAECLKLGKTAEARNNFQRCVDITPEMAFELIKECRKRNIDCIVAPYEADAQLAYLNRNKIADFVISEDSDLLAFGCTKVLFKLDLSGRGTLVESEKLYLATKDRPDTYSLDRFRHMCILSGCDYLDSLPGVGLKKALKFIKSISSDDIYNNLVKLPKVLNMPTLIVTKEYRDQFMIADATFRHQLVFDVIQKKLVPLTDPEKCGTNLEYCCNSGKLLEDKIAYQIALGNYNPFTHKEFSNWKPQKSNFSSIWCRSSYTNKQLIVNNIFKAQTKPKLKTESKNIPDSPVDDNVDEKILMIYSVKTIEEKVDINEETEEPPAKKIKMEQNSPKKHPLSPILGGRKHFTNPFLKKNRNNSLTNTEELEKRDKEVISKYFCDETTKTTVETDDYTIKDNSSITMATRTNEDDSDGEELQSSLKENANSPNTCESSPSNHKKSPNSNQNSPNTSKNSPNIKNSPSTNKISQNTNKNSPNTCESSLNVGEKSPNSSKSCPSYLSIDLSSDIEPIKTKIEVITAKSEEKSLKPLIRCRPPGLSRSIKNCSKFKPNKSQPTLLSMFGFTKK